MNYINNLPVMYQSSDNQRIETERMPGGLFHAVHI